MSAYQKINQMITDRLVERIEATQELPWKKPWTSLSLMPKNLVTKKNYRGVNVFLLHMLGYSSPYFLSFKQVTALGGKVRKGEKSCPVVFWRFVEAQEQDDPKKGYAFLRYYNVFNTEQCEGLEGKVPVVEIPKREHTPLEIAEDLVKSMPNPPVIKHGCRQASYSPSLDLVSMPDPESFESGESYYSALWHEVGHSVGHASRIGRKAIMEPSGFGSHGYSQEELVAEMTAAFLCGYCGILMSTETNQAAYLKGWLERLKSDPTMLVKAGGEAQKAFDYIMDARVQEQPVELQEAA
ncbi:DNA primase TraC [Pontiella desulfatans]|uniref:DNA primase TraC n=1 Tax=Pontiella desulfatans TaxID=2750659 RepID=A0A6C2U4I9_PONDE|nr:zincin-like metallopeptidase domain-containing protein [Pontiella desulfatans]VGO14434.1 DNA primase TraC [Pontiella desulfatans]